MLVKFNMLLDVVISREEHTRPSSLSFTQLDQHFEISVLLSKSVTHPMMLIHDNT
jgi:hypothetical protein